VTTPYRLLLISNQPVRTLWNLARRIEKELPDVRIAGIVLDKSKNDSGSRRGWSRIVDSLLSVLHGGAHPLAPAFGSEQLMDECRQRHWPVLNSSEVDNHALVTFVTDSKADLALVLGNPGLGPQILNIPRYGSLRVHVSNSLGNNGNGKHRSPVAEARPHGLRVSIEPDFSAQPAERVISVRIPPQVFDTPASASLVADLITNDLLIRAVTSLSQGQTTRAGEEVWSWAHDMLASCFSARATKINAPDSVSWRDKYDLKLAFKRLLSILILCSPYVIARNLYRRWTGTFPVIFLFHHLVSNRSHRMAIPTDKFLRQVEFLQRHYRIVSLSEAVEIVRSGTCKVPTVCLTFDDGYEDNFLYLRAVAEALGVPVALFICTKPIESRKEFTHDLKKGITGFHALGWDQIRYWRGDGVEFGSHTRSHLDCGISDVHVLQNELAGARDDIAAHLAAPPRFFAFPWGKETNMSREALRIATSLYDCSFSTISSANFPRKGNVLRFAGRKPLPSTVGELELTVQSIFDFSSHAWDEYNDWEEHTENCVMAVSDGVQQK
jgi:peptidoglycan/xylan/chitin deacetylase (PgdA/CDA1 family)